MCPRQDSHYSALAATSLQAPALPIPQTESEIWVFVQHETPENTMCYNMPTSQVNQTKHVCICMGSNAFQSASELAGKKENAGDLVLNIKKKRGVPR